MKKHGIRGMLKPLEMNIFGCCKVPLTIFVAFISAFDAADTLFSSSAPSSKQSRNSGEKPGKGSFRKNKKSLTIEIPDSALTPQTVVVQEEDKSVATQVTSREDAPPPSQDDINKKGKKEEESNSVKKENNESADVASIHQKLVNTQCNLGKAVHALVSLRSNFNSDYAAANLKRLEYSASLKVGGSNNEESSFSHGASKQGRVSDLQKDIKTVEHAVTTAKETLDEICTEWDEIAPARKEILVLQSQGDPVATVDTNNVTDRNDKVRPRTLQTAAIESNLGDLREIEVSLTNTNRALAATINALAKERDRLANHLQSVAKELRKTRSEKKQLERENKRILSELQTSNDKLNKVENKKDQGIVSPGGSAGESPNITTELEALKQQISCIVDETSHF